MQSNGRISFLSTTINMRHTKFIQGVKLFFGVFMVLVYLAMAVALALNLFQWNNTPYWNAIRWFFAIVFAAYGIYRGYREVKGEHSYGMRQMEDDEHYTTYGKRLNDQNKEVK